MARPKKVIEEVVAEEVVEAKPVSAKLIAMIRDESYPEPRTADVNPTEVAEWSKYGWLKK